MPKDEFKTYGGYNKGKHNLVNKIINQSLIQEDYTRLNFGKWKGIKIQDIPTDYLNWVIEVVENINLYRRDVIIKELKTRSEK